MNTTTYDHCNETNGRATTSFAIVANFPFLVRGTEDRHSAFLDYFPSSFSPSRSGRGFGLPVLVEGKACNGMNHHHHIHGQSYTAAPRPPSSISPLACTPPWHAALASATCPAPCRNGNQGGKKDGGGMLMCTKAGPEGKTGKGVHVESRGVGGRERVVWEKQMAVGQCCHAASEWGSEGAALVPLSSWMIDLCLLVRSTHLGKGEANQGLSSERRSWKRI
ncbi:hypothetical protein B0T16DRAFT_15552 [Cercophora newfieldiana]|uniref:Uncharacterized protein n=1 Tax=Cercophora newfieldiana TaxID=92897 RepID=A0AA40CY20_9PEZI|nr:hypothetical protein B0T16DRAFT_15552 [Cercophora newfieldiana]